MAGFVRAGQSLVSPRRVTLSAVVLWSLQAAAVVPARADDAATRPSTDTAAADPDAWRFRAASYGWMMSVSGNVTARGQTVDVNESFVQLMQKSDSLIGFMGYFEANKGPVGVYADIVWAKLGFAQGSTNYRNPIAGLKISTTTNAALIYSMTIVDVGGTYELGRWSGSPGSLTTFDALLGLRYWNNSLDLNLDVTGSIDLSRLGIERGRSFSVARSGDVNWIDPVVGLRVRHQFAPRQELMVWGDIGGFGLQSQLTWQAVATYTYGWQFTGYQLAAVVGYRALAVDYSTGSGADIRGANILLHGPLVGFSLRF